MKKILATIFFTCLFLVTHTVYALPTMKITFRVIDENGEPIEGAEVGASLERAKLGGVGVESTDVVGLSDSNGIYTVKGSGGSYLGYSVEKDGYYETVDRFREFTGVSGIYGFRKWQPWNPTIDVILKKIKNPIPMYVAQLKGLPTYDNPPAILPEEGKFFGFDLIAKDWVVPYGQGLHSDFLFKVDVAYDKGVDNYDATMTLKFSNPDDGIQAFYTPENRGSDLRSAHHAPLTEYQDKLTIRDYSRENKIYKSPYRDDQNYYFRIRTKRDEQGNIIDAHYGKIYGSIEFLWPREGNKGKLYFSYYLNPNNNDTNVENAPEKNLFPKPKDHVGPYRFLP